MTSCEVASSPARQKQRTLGCHTPQRLPSDGSPGQARACASRRRWSATTAPARPRWSWSERDALPSRCGGAVAASHGDVQGGPLGLDRDVSISGRVEDALCRFMEGRRYSITVWCTKNVSRPIPFARRLFVRLSTTRRSRLELSGGAPAPSAWSEALCGGDISNAAFLQHQAAKSTEFEFDCRHTAHAIMHRILSFCRCM